MIEMLSIDLSNYCSKQCSFCYNHSTKRGNVMWTPSEVLSFAKDCIAHGVKAVSLGGGEPFEYDGVFRIIEALYPLCYLTITSNGIPLENPDIWERLKAQHPDKIHLTIHQPQSEEEVSRVVRQLGALENIGIKPGVNLLVGKDNLPAAIATFEKVSKVLEAEQIILVPQRFGNTPTPRELAKVSMKRPFQSPSCLLACAPPSHFASVTWDKKVGSCSFTAGKAPLPSLNFEGLCVALKNAQFKSCLS